MAKKAKHHKYEFSPPCCERMMQQIRDVIAGLRDLPYEHLIVDLENKPGGMQFIQTVRLEDDGDFRVEIAMDCGKDKPQLFCLDDVSQADTTALFEQVCFRAETVDLTGWKDITRDVFWKEMKMKVFKQSYKVVRENADEIYCGFGFRHLSDATQYYVHPDNQSRDGTTTLCQPIGEALILFAQLLRDAAAADNGTAFVFDRKTQDASLCFAVSDAYRRAGVVSENVFCYKALRQGQTVTVGAYGENGDWLDGDLESLTALYKLLPVFLVLLCCDAQRSETFRNRLFAFAQEPAADTFVCLHEDFYQSHKNEEFTISYCDLTPLAKNGTQTFFDTYAVVSENLAEARRENTQSVLRFADDRFSAGLREFVPSLPPEFVLPQALRSVCSAVTSGDLLSVLFHGPAGTGKTMSCKLIAQTIGLPILETINCTENLDEFVLGKYIPQGDRIVFMESGVTRAIRDGGAVVFEEINFAKPQYLAFLNSLLDDNGFVRLDSGEIVRRHPDFRFFATMNMGYFGTRELNQALFNRFNAVIEITALSDEAILRMLTMRVPVCAPMAEKMLGVYHKVRKRIETEELDLVISPRNLENWARLAQYDGYVRAAEKTIIPIAKCDRAMEDTIRGIMMLYKWSET